MCRRIVASVFLFPLALLTAADPPKEKDKKEAGLRVGADLPGPFHPYNVTGKYGPKKVEGKDEEEEGRFHCPVTEQAEDPMVLVFTRDTEVGDKLKSLLDKLDAAAVANRNLRLAVAAVFLDKAGLEPEKDLLQFLAIPEKPKPEEEEKVKALMVLARALTADDARRELAAKLREKFAGKFKDVNEFTNQNLTVVCIAHENDLLNYKLNASHKVTVVLCNKLEVKAIHAVEELDDARIDAIMKDVADRLGATRKGP